MPRLSQCRVPVGWGWILLAVAITGCPTKDEPDEPIAMPLAGAELKVLVVEDPAIAEAAGKLRGEWETQTNSSFDVRELTTAEFLAAGAIEDDVIIAPSHLLGELAARNLTTPLPKQTRKIGGQWSGIFELPKLNEAALDGSIEAVPFGSPVLICYYRKDMLDELRRQPPTTWKEYHELAGLLADREKLGAAAPAADAPWCGVIEPLAPGWGGLTLLARAAAYAKHPDFHSMLFDSKTKEPLIAGPPFVRALTELVEAAKLGAEDPLKHDPTTARAAFWNGHCGMALTWPTAAAEIENPSEGVTVGFAELPGSTDVYHLRDNAWEKRPEDTVGHVPLLGIAGRLGVVSNKTQRLDAAYQLLFWLSGDDMGTQVCSASPATTLFRRSQMKVPTAWTEKPVPAEAASEYAEQTQATFQRQQYATALRMPKRDQYLAALDRAVANAVTNKQSPAEALEEAADTWRTLNASKSP